MFGGASCDGAGVLELVEEALDTVAIGVQGEIRVGRSFDDSSGRLEGIDSDNAANKVEL